MKLLFVLILSFFTSQSFCLSDVFKSDLKSKFEITHLDRTITFFEEDGIVKAKMHVELRVKSLSVVNLDFQHVVFLDSYSRIENSKKNKKKYKPSVSDFEQDGIFYNDLKVAQFIAKADNMEEVVIKYDKIFENYKMLDLVYFHDFGNPVLHSEVSIIVPHWLDLTIKEFNFENYEIKKDVFEEKKVNEYYFGIYDLEMPKKFGSAPSRGKVFPHLMFILNSANHSDVEQKLMPSLAELYSWYASLVSFVDNDKSVLKSYLDNIVNESDSDIDKVKSIYYWVQDNIKYIAFEYGIMGFKPESCQNVIGQKYGDCKGMSNLMKQMLIMTGFDARLCWLGTNDVAYDYDTPTVYADNHMICMVNLNGERIFLDGTQKYTGLNSFNQGIQGRQVLIEDGDSFILDKIPSFDAEHNKFVNKIDLKIEGDMFVGNGNSLITGNQVSEYLNVMNSQNDFESEELLGYYLTYDPKNVICEVAVDSDSFSRDDDIKFDYGIKLKNRITNIGNELYLNPEIRHDFSDFIIEDDRTVDYEFSGKKVITFNTNVVIPDGFSVSYMPEKISYDSSTASFDLSFEKNENIVFYNKTITIKSNILPVDEFEDWNSFMNQLTDFYNDQIIFTK